VCRKVCRLGPVELQPGNAADSIHRVGQVNDVVLAVGLEALMVGCRRTQEEIPPPECSEIEVEFALCVDKQRAATFLLQHLPAIGALEVEVPDQVIEVTPIRIGTKVGPAPQAGQGEHGEQLVDIAEHRTQATRSLCGELVDERQVTTKQLRVAEATCRSRQAGKQQRNDLAGRHRGELHRGFETVPDHVLAALLDDCRHLFEVRQHDVVTAAKIAESPGTFHVIVQARRRHDARSVVEGGLQCVGNLRGDLFQACGVVFEFDGHRLTPGVRVRRVSSADEKRRYGRFQGLPHVGIVR
jgi:hypothetical protein